MYIFTLLLTVVASIFSLFLGLIVYKKKKHSATNKLFLCLSLLIVIWIIIDFFSIYPTFIEDPLIFIRLTIFFAVPQTFFLFLLAHTFPKESMKLKTKYVYSLIAVCVAVMLVTISPYAFTETILTEGLPEAVSGPGLGVFGIYTFVLLFVSIYLLSKKYKKSDEIGKKQLSLILTGLILMYSLIFFTIFIPVAIFSVYTFVPFHPLYTLLFLSFTTYAIIRYRFMDIRFVMKKGTAHLISIIVILALYTSLILFAQQTLMQKFSWNSTAVTIGAVLIIAISIEPLRRLIIKTVNNVLYSPKEKKREQVSEDAKHGLTIQQKEEMYAKKLRLTESATDELQEIVAKVMGEYLAFLEGADVILFVADGEKKLFSLAYGQPKKQEKEIGIEHPLHLYLNQFSDIIITKEIPYLLQQELRFEKTRLAEVELYLERHNIEVVIPIGQRDHIMGILCIGAKISGQLYSDEDIKALTDFRSITSPVLSNAIRYRILLQQAQVPE